jgi:hypothetical protein
MKEQKHVAIRKPPWQVFYSGEVIKAVPGMTWGRLNEWLEKEWITPSRQRGNDYGVWHRFSRGDVYLVAIFFFLTRNDVPRKLVANVLKALQEIVDRPLETYIAHFLIVPKRDGKIVEDSIEFTPITKKSYTSHCDGNDFDSYGIYNIGKVVRQTTKAIQKVESEKHD